MDKLPEKKIVSVNFSHSLFFWISWPLKLGSKGCPETSVRNYHPMLQNISEEQRSHMMIGWCRPWFGSVWSGSEQTGSALHTW